MKTNKASKSIQKNDQSKMLTKIITNLNEIDLNDIKSKKKRSSSKASDNDKSKVWKLFKRTSSPDEHTFKNIMRNKSFSNSDNSLKLKDNPRNSIKLNENTAKNKCRKNFVLKSELFELNKKQEKTKSPILRGEGRDNNININNNYYSPDNHLEFENIIKNMNEINNMKEPNDKSQENIMSNYNQTDLIDKFSKQNLNNNINYNEIKDK